MKKKLVLFLVVMAMAASCLGMTLFAASASEADAVYNLANGGVGWAVPNGIDYAVGRTATQVTANADGALRLVNDELNVDGTVKTKIVVKMQIDAADTDGIAAGLTFNDGDKKTVQYAAGDIAKMNTGDFACFVFDNEAATVTKLAFEPIGTATAGDKVAVAFIAFCAASDVDTYTNAEFDVETVAPSNGFQVIAFDEAEVAERNENSIATKGEPHDFGIVRSGWTLKQVPDNKITCNLVTRDDGPNGSEYKAMQVVFTSDSTLNIDTLRMAIMYDGSAGINDELGSHAAEGDYLVVRFYSPKEYTPTYDTYAQSNPAAGRLLLSKGGNTTTQVWTNALCHTNDDDKIVAGWNCLYYPLTPLFEKTYSLHRIRLDFVAGLANLFSTADGEQVEFFIDSIFIGGKDDGSHTNFPKGVYDQYTGGQTGPIEVSAVTVNGNPSMVAGTQQTLTATVAPANATEKGVTWSSSNDSVATVDANTGVVTATAGGGGSVTITATAKDGSGVKGTFDITVTADAVAVTGVKLDASTAALKVGETKQLTATVEPANATDQTVTWSTSDQTVATVSTAGLVTAVKAGSATITVTTTDGDKTATCAVTVSNVGVESVTLNSSAESIVVGKTKQLTATVAPANATDKTVSWKSSDDKIATVSATGLVTAVKAGSATITVTTTDGGKTATCAITVTAAPVAVTGVTLDATTAKLTVGATKQLTATVAPADATNKSVSWTTSNASVATVQDGLVTAVAAGEAVITVKTADGNKTATCTVTVPAGVPVTGVTLDATTAALKVGETKQLTATVAPDDATDKAIVWSSSDETVATVKDGLITALKEGIVTIRVTTADGEFSAVCNVTVTASATDPGDKEPDKQPDDGKKGGCSGMATGGIAGLGLAFLALGGVGLIGKKRNKE